MGTNTDDLKIKYPTSHHAPDPNCPRCHGKGERTVHIKGNEFIKEQDVISACICIFVDHKYCNMVASSLNKIAKEFIDPPHA